MKKLCLFALCLCFLAFAGCSSSSQQSSEAAGNIEGTLDELMPKVIEGLDPELALMEFPITKDNFSSYFFIDYVEGSTGLASDAAINAIPHSVALLRLPESEDSKAVCDEIEKNLDPRKWICVEAEASKVLAKGNLILVVMSDQATVDLVAKNFEALS